jgi:5-methylcytosine-specific restriction endonuclease McrA
MATEKRSKKIFFREIWESDRPRKCELCLQPIFVPLAHVFSHILSCGSNPKGAFDPDNIMYNHPECHHKWEFGDASQMPGFKDVEEKKQQLKEKYNNPNHPDYVR